MTISGRFETATFCAALVGQDYDITGSYNTDFAAPNSIVSQNGDDGFFGFGGNDNDTVSGESRDNI